MSLPNEFMVYGSEEMLKPLILQLLAQHYISKDLGTGGQTGHPYIALPTETVEGYPQVQLWFYEKPSVAKLYKRDALSSRVSFRIKEDNWTPNEAQALAARIRDIFAKPIFQFNTGRHKVTYVDKKKGYLFILTVPGKAEAKTVLQKVFQLMNDTPNWNNLKISESEEEFPAAGKSVRVYGKTVQQHSNRSGTTVYFRYAIAKIPPLPHDIALVDTTELYKNAFYYEPNPFLTEEPSPRSSYGPQLSLNLG